MDEENDFDEGLATSFSNREANAVVELVYVLGLVRFAATIIYNSKTDTNLLVADKAIQFLKQKLSGRGRVADELLESLEERYLKRRNRNPISASRFISKKSNAGSKLNF